MNELPARIVELSSSDGGIAKVCPYGAHVLSWVTGDGCERLYLSPRAEYRAGVAIRGGVPVIFPQFAGMGNLPKHGFARTLDWEGGPARARRASFRLCETEATRKFWPHRFLVEYTVNIDKDRLEMALSIRNTDTAAFTFTAALHTYLRVEAVSEAAVEGLQGHRFRDATRAEEESRETAERVTFPGEVDRLYPGVRSPLRLVCGARSLKIHAEGFPDAVIWNPGAEKSARMGDLGAEGYRHFVCVEAAAAAEPVCLAPGGTWEGKQILLA